MPRTDTTPEDSVLPVSPDTPHTTLLAPTPIQPLHEWFSGLHLPFDADTDLLNSAMIPSEILLHGGSITINTGVISRSDDTLPENLRPHFHSRLWDILMNRIGGLSISANPQDPHAPIIVRFDTVPERECIQRLNVLIACAVRAGVSITYTPTEMGA